MPADNNNNDGGGGSKSLLGSTSSTSRNNNGVGLSNLLKTPLQQADQAGIGVGEQQLPLKQQLPPPLPQQQEQTAGPGQMSSSALLNQLVG